MKVVCVSLRPRALPSVCDLKPLSAPPAARFIFNVQKIKAGGAGNLDVEPLSSTLALFYLLVVSFVVSVKLYILLFVCW